VWLISIPGESATLPPWTDKARRKASYHPQPNEANIWGQNNDLIEEELAEGVALDEGVASQVGVARSLAEEKHPFTPTTTNSKSPSAALTVNDEL